MQTHENLALPKWVHSAFWVSSFGVFLIFRRMDSLFLLLLLQTCCKIRRMNSLSRWMNSVLDYPPNELTFNGKTCFQKVSSFGRRNPPDELTFNAEWTHFPLNELTFRWMNSLSAEWTHFPLNELSFGLPAEWTHKKKRV